MARLGRAGPRRPAVDAARLPLDARRAGHEPPARQGTTRGLILAEFGDRPITQITTTDISKFLRSLDAVFTSPRTVNTHRQVLSAIFNYARREDTYRLPVNPVSSTDKRREPPAAALDFFEPEEIEPLAQAAADGAHRKEAIGRGGKIMDLGPEEIVARAEEDAQDAELFRVLAYTGLRLGEALALQWGDVDFKGRRLIVQRAVSGNIEGPTKGWQVRYVPLADPARDALERLLAREDFTQREDYVFCGRLGGRARRLRAAPPLPRRAQGRRPAPRQAPRPTPRRRQPGRPPHRCRLRPALPRPREARHHRALHAREGSARGHRAAELRLRCGAQARSAGAVGPRSA